MMLLEDNMITKQKDCYFFSKTEKVENSNVNSNVKMEVKNV